MKLNIDSTIDKGNFKGKKVFKILLEDKKNIFNLLKEGFLFTDDVLEKAGIKKTEHSHMAISSIVEHDRTELNKKYEKDKIDILTLIDELIIKDDIKLSSDKDEEKNNTEDNLDDDEFELPDDDIE